MRWAGLVVLVFSLLVLLPGESKAEVVAKIIKSTQTMKVYVNGVKTYQWRVSTARRGYYTPVGQWRPKWLARMHYSRKYHMSPMPYSIFFKGGYAIHGTRAVRRLGRTASHGCIRLHTSNARRLYSLVQRHGKRNTRVVIVNSERRGDMALGIPSELKTLKAKKKVLLAALQSPRVYAATDMEHEIWPASI